MKTRLIRHSLFVCLVVMLVSGCQSGLLSSGKGRAFHLVFEDAQGITAGTPLVYQGVTIGDVTAVKLITPQSAEPTAPCQLDAAQLKQVMDAVRKAAASLVMSSLSFVNATFFSFNQNLPFRQLLIPDLF